MSYGSFWGGLRLTQLDAVTLRPVGESTLHRAPQGRHRGADHRAARRLGLSVHRRYDLCCKRRAEHLQRSRGPRPERVEGPIPGQAMASRPDERRRDGTLLEAGGHALERTGSPGRRRRLAGAPRLRHRTMAASRICASSALSWSSRRLAGGSAHNDKNEPETRTVAGLKLENVCKRYGAVQVIENQLSLDVAEGEFVVFLGPSGCGKTSLLRMVAGLEEVSGGRIFIGEKRRDKRRAARPAQPGHGVPALRAVPAHDACARTWRSA